MPVSGSMKARGEVAMSVDHLRWFAEEGKRAYGRWIPHQANGKRNLVIKTPMGVAAAISPWNFPLVLSVRKIAPALAAVGLYAAFLTGKMSQTSCNNYD